MQQDAQHEAHAVLVSDLNRPAGLHCVASQVHKSWTYCTVQKNETKQTESLKK